jgi:TatD DNase family protein
VLPCFSWVLRRAAAIDRGYHCSFAGNVAYPSAGALRAAAARVPDASILAETDSPYLAPPPHRGRPNQPAYVAVTLGVLARERGVEPAALAATIDANADRLFGL